jgi:alpha/beta superfamily hydrolase
MKYWDYLARNNQCIARKCIEITLLGFIYPSLSLASEYGFNTLCFTESALIDAYKAAIYDPQAKTDWDKYIDDGLEKDSFQTMDGKTIHGLVWKSAEPNGYLLIAQGTSMLAAEIYEQFREFRDIGLDVYLYDYRGYGESGDIDTTLEGIVSDYSIRVSELNKLPAYKKHFIFGISLGGVIFSNAIKEMHGYIHGAVFDSVPHAVPWYAFCPSEVDPVKLLPDSCGNWLFVGAEKDKVIGRRAAKFARRATEYCGAQTKIEKHFGHIFMDDRNNTKERMAAAKRHFELLVGK